MSNTVRQRKTTSSSTKKKSRPEESTQEAQTKVIPRRKTLAKWLFLSLTLVFFLALMGTLYLVRTQTASQLSLPLGLNINNLRSLPEGPTSFAFLVWGIGRELDEHVTLAKELQSQGHKVIIATAKRHLEVVLKNGIEFRQVGSVEQDRILEKAIREEKLSKFSHSSDQISAFWKYSSTILLHEWLKVAINADIVVADAFMPGCLDVCRDHVNLSLTLKVMIAISEAVNKPFVFLAQEHMYMPSMYHIYNPFTNEINHREWALANVYTYRAMSFYYGIKFRSEISIMRRKLGLDEYPPLESLEAFYPLRLKSLFVIYTFPEFLFPRTPDWPNTWVGTGPLTKTNYHPHIAHQEGMSEVKKFVDVNKKYHRSVAFMDIRSYDDEYAKYVYSTILEIAQSSSWSFVVTFGELDEKLFNEVGKHPTILVASEVLQTSELQRIVDVNIHSGSDLFVKRALMAGKPSICVPFSHLQKTWCDIIADIGAGDHIPKLNFNLQTLTQSLTNCQEERVLRRAEAIQRELFKQEGLNLATRVLTSLPSELKERRNSIYSNPINVPRVV